MGTEEQYLAQIQAKYPDLEIQSSQFLEEEGQYNDVIIVNENLVFRFPRFPEAIEIARRETAVLRQLRSHLPLPVPDSGFHESEEDQPGHVFTTYAFIEGQPFTRQAYGRLSPSQRRAVAEQLAQFLQSLHQYPIEDLPAAMPREDDSDYWAQMFRDFQKHLFHLMHPDACQWVTDNFRRYFDQPSVYGFEPVLRHGDFGSSNILIDTKSGRIAGVIDFGSLAVGDAAADGAAVSTVSEALFQAMSYYYPEMPAWQSRIKFYRSTFALQEALIHIQAGEKKAAAKVLQTYVWR